jgi:YgiT-type zinc finger domain-containing protein
MDHTMDKEETKMKCPLCGGEFKHQIITYEARWGKKLYSFKEVPALVCESCGDISFSHEAMKKIDRIIKKHEKPEGYEKVPIFSLQKFLSHKTIT